MALLVAAGCGSSGNSVEKSTAESAAETSPTPSTSPTTLRPTRTAASATTTIELPTTTVRPSTTPAPPKQGTRTNPFPGTGLTFGDWDGLSVSGLGPIDYSIIANANQFNTAPGPGQQYLAMIVIANYTGSDVGRPSSLRHDLRLVGAKNKIYDAAYISDGFDTKTLSLLNDAPDVVQGGSVSGANYYLVDADDSGFMVVVDANDGPQYVVPA